MTAAAGLVLALLAAVPVAPAAPPAGHPCADCHPGAVTAWSGHGMARALAEADAGTLAPLHGARLRDPGSPYTYEVRVRDGRGHLLERAAAPAGFPAHLQQRVVRGFVGAGVQDRSLVLEHEGRLWFAPVEWSTRHGLVLAPHQELTPGTRLGLPLTRECIACHADRPPPHAYPANLAAGISLDGIGCAGCHGDAGRHLESAGAAPMVDLGGLPTARQLDVCARCHLQGDARVELRPDDAPPFVPGDDLFRRRAAFVPRVPGDDFGFVSAVERLASSRCFTASAGRLNCTTCHDPHAPELPVERVDRACHGCHAPAACGRPGGAAAPLPARGCAECHLRRSAPFDLRRVTVTDHFIRRTLPPPADEPAALRVHAAPDADLVRFRWPLPGEADGDAAEDAGAFAMALMHLGHPDRALPRFESLATKTPPVLDRLPRYHFMHGRALEAAGRPADAAAAYRRALALDPGDAEAGVNLGLLLALKGEEEAAAVLGRVAREHPAAEAPWRNLAVLHARRGDAAAVAAALGEALARRSDQPSVWMQLGNLRLQQQDVDGAAAAYEEARRHDPALPGIYTRLGLVRLRQGRIDDARAAFAEALRRDPDDRAARVGRERAGG